MAQPASLGLAVGLMCAGIFHILGLPVFPNDRESTLATHEYRLYLSFSNRNFSDSLLDPTSDYYKSLKFEVVDLLNQVYACPDCPTKSFYGGAKNMTFSDDHEQPSAAAAVTLVFNTNEINGYIVWFLFSDARPSTPLQIGAASLEYI